MDQSAPLGQHHMMGAVARPVSSTATLPNDTPVSYASAAGFLATREGVYAGCLHLRGTQAGPLRDATVLRVLRGLTDSPRLKQILLLIKKMSAIAF